MTEIESEQGHTLANVVRTVTTIAILAFGFAGLAAMAVYGTRDAPLEEPEALRAPLVQTEAVMPQRERLDIDVDGVVVPRREIAVAAEVGGRVIEKADVCEAGKYVRKGTPLIEIDPSDYVIEQRRLEEELKQAKVNLEELGVEETNTGELIKLARETLTLKHREIARLEKIASQGKEYVTESQLDTERGNELTARNALVMLENQLRSIKARRSRLEAARDLVNANLDKAKLNLSRTKVVAPIDGMVVRDSVEVDGYVGPGTVLAVIEDVSKCDVRCNLRMDQLSWILNQGQVTNTSAMPVPGSGQDYLLQPTDTTVIYKLGDREYSWQGKLLRYDGIGLDETTRTVPCIVVVDKPNEVRQAGVSGVQKVRGPRALVRGMYVKLIIHAELGTALLRIPECSIQPGEHGNRVWCVRFEGSASSPERVGRLDEIPVKVVSVMGDAALVRPLGDDLKAGDHVVVSPMASAEEGMQVRAESEKSP